MLKGLLNRIFRILLITKHAEDGTMDFQSMTLVQLSESARMSRLCSQNERLVVSQYAFFAATQRTFLCGVCSPVWHKNLSFGIKHIRD